MSVALHVNSFVSGDKHVCLHTRVHYNLHLINTVPIPSYNLANYLINPFFDSVTLCTN